MTVLVSVLVRALVVGGAGVGTGLLVGLISGKDGGANIGAGLLAFLVLIVLSAAWAFVDGRRAATLGRVIGIWAVVALLVATAMVLQIQWQGDLDTAVLSSDLLTVGPFVLALVWAPAAVGAVLGSLLAPKEPRLSG